MNKVIIQKLFPDMLKLIEKNKCPICSDTIRADEFTDTLSVKEFRISGMCQKCQDNIFKDSIR